MTNYREILRLANIGLNRTSIGTTLGYSRNTVADVLKRAEAKNISWPLPGGMSDVELEASLYPEKAAKGANRRMPDYEKIHKDLGRRGVTFSLLWDEYCADCRQTGEIPYGFTQFRYHYYEYVQQNKATMHIEHKPGYEVEVDWAGAKLSIMDSDIGEMQPAYLFVGALPCSGYAYAEAFLSMDNEAWINAHVHMFRFFGGVPRVIKPDNLKTGVIKADYYEPKLNRSYAEMAEYYGCAILPARVKKPKDYLQNRIIFKKSAELPSIARQFRRILKIINQLNPQYSSRYCSLPFQFFCFATVLPMVPSRSTDSNAFVMVSSSE